ncbi:MAG: reverse transcriptase domain-containing protein, partial [Candidatus Thiodiazotropha sp.]
DGARSNQADVLSGVPQGTVLGPLLFLAYINDLPETLNSSDCRLFADDSLLYRIVNKAQDCEHLQSDLTSLEEWEKTWQMSFNPSKCSVIRVSPGKKKKLFQSDYELHGQKLEVVECSKYLGATVTDNLSWSKHISDTAGKANRSLGFLRRNFRQCSRQVKAATYTTVVRPVLEYASPVWDPHRQADIKVLDQVQRRAARYVCNDYSSRSPGCVTDMIHELGWESLEERRRMARLSLLYKIHHGLVDMDQQAYLRPGDSRTRGHKGFFQEHISHEAYYNSFFPKTIREWNSLPNSVTSASTVDGFRASLMARLGPI